MVQTKLPKPNVIIMDLMGTAVKMGFIEKILMPFAKTEVKAYLDDKWRDKKCQKDVERLRKDAEKDESGPKIAAATEPEDQQKESVAAFVTAAIDGKKEGKGMQMFKFNLWFWGYEKGSLETPIYSDVAIQVKKWKDMDIKIYVLSNGWIEFQKKVLSKTNHGDLNLMLDGHYDSSEGQLNSKETFVRLLAKMNAKPEDTLFMTKSGEGARAAKEAKVAVLLVLTHRKSIDKLTEEEKALPRIRSFNELEFGTKEATGGGGAPEAPKDAPKDTSKDASG